MTVQAGGLRADERPFEVVEATPIVGESTDAAHVEALAWLAARTGGQTDG